MTRYAAFLIDDLMPSRVSDVPFGCYEIDSLPSQVGVAICHGLEVFPEHRGRGLSPERPFIRGTAQNPDVYFQSRETVNPYYDRVAGEVARAMDELAERLVATLPRSAERTVALRKLLEGKDAAVRAALP